MKVTVIQSFYDLKAFTGRRAGEVIEVPEDRGARLIGMRLAKAEGEKPEKAETPKTSKPRTKKSSK